MASTVCSRLRTNSSVKWRKRVLLWAIVDRAPARVGKEETVLFGWRGRESRSRLLWKLLIAWASDRGTRVAMQSIGLNSWLLQRILDKLLRATGTSPWSICPWTLSRLGSSCKDRNKRWRAWCNWQWNRLCAPYVASTDDNGPCIMPGRLSNLEGTARTWGVAPCFQTWKEALWEPTGIQDLRERQLHWSLVLPHRWLAIHSAHAHL